MTDSDLPAPPIRTSLAAVCTELSGEGGMTLQQWPVPPLGPAMVRITVHAASVNFPDVLIVRGLYQVRPDPPFVPGSECAGVISEVGADVADFAVGDRVLTLLGSGAFASEVVVTPRVQQVHRLPESMPFDAAAAFNLAYGTAYHGLIPRGRLTAGESVLVLGAAGGCGSAAVQIAKAAGATVIAVAGGPAKCELVRTLGADVALDHQQLPSLSAAVKEATGGRGVDVVFDAVGGADAREPLRCLAWNGRYLMIGFASGEIPAVKLNQTILKGISIVGVGYGMSAVLDPAANAQDFQQLFAWYEQGLVTPFINDRFPLAQAADAMRVLYERRAMGKIVIQVPG
ncbi:MAG TPA: NADPH:quinone oxidoreductase family protein [Frankiaceae bacterium]|jgi:NADPH2:quinone reductase|nr:NADPH:quinone oxidoreductase family protein [Frankiaceae bacterium]